MKVYKIKVNGKLYKVELESVEETASTLEVNEKKEEVVKASTGEGNEVLSPIQGILSSPSSLAYNLSP